MAWGSCTHFRQTLSVSAVAAWKGSDLVVSLCSHTLKGEIVKVDKHRSERGQLD